MKCMIAFACLLAVASAGYLGNVASYAGAYDDGSYKGEGYNGLYNGVYGAGVYGAGVYGAGVYGRAVAYANQGTPSVAYNAPLVSAPHPVRVAQTYAAPLVHGYSHGYSHVSPIAHGYGYAAPLATQARLVDPVAIAAGAPLPTGDTVEVAAAKAVHYQAHAAAKGIAYSAISPAVAYSGYAHAAPIAHAYGYAAPIASEARLVDPVAIAAGAPLPTGDTVEVAAAKAFHHQAHVAAKVGHLQAKGHYLVKRSPGYLNAGYASPLAYSAPAHSYGYSSYASPLAYSGYSGYGYGGHISPYYG